jgi:hypothetical protein
MTKILENKTPFAPSAIATIIADQLPDLAQGYWRLHIDEHTDHTDETFLCIYDAKPAYEELASENVLIRIV